MFVADSLSATMAIMLSTGFFTGFGVLAAITTRLLEFAEK
jgi:hypothetical protein